MFFMLQVYERSSNKHILRILAEKSKQSLQKFIQCAYEIVQKILIGISLGLI